ncbi:ATP-binding protein [Streptomyces sp. NPDC090023]|uniref:ATP-binding protein n=1 Tax=unclassified Streptomyces TaxID=2593676 RepID=UPI0038123BB0
MTVVEQPPHTRQPSGWTTRRWLRLGVTVAMSVLVLLGATGAWALGRTASISDNLVDVKSPALTTSIRLESALLNQETGIRGYGLTGSTEFLAPYRQGLGQQRTYTKTLSDLLRGNPARLRDLKTVEDRIETWQAQIARPVAASPAGKPSPLATENATRGKTTFDAVRAAMATQQDGLRADRASARADLAATMRLRNWIFTAIAAVIVALAVIVSEALRRGITSPLERIGADARTIAEGDFGHSITPTGPADLRRLSGEIESMRRRLVRALDFSEEARLRLDEQSADLKRSNAELEQFAYVASHDLQEPLRKVSSFTQLLQRRYGGQLDERADQYIDFAVDGANRMQTLINDLLDFSRVGRVHNTHQSVDLNVVMKRTLTAISVSVEESGAVITRDELPTLIADSTQMGMLWQNLIGNAIKFRRPGETPAVHISAEQDGDFWRFAVTDNGIGIAAEYAEKVFVIFQRLHTKDRYQGSGIGLAMCKKIVEFHGGTIFVDLEHTGGTRIVFTLASRPMAPLESDDLDAGAVAL